MIVVAIKPGQRNTGALALAGVLAHVLREQVLAVAIVVYPSDLPSPLRIGMSDADVIGLIASGALHEAREVLGGALHDSLALRGSSVRSGMLDVAEQTGASQLVLGSGSRAEPGHVSIGPAARALLHASTVPVSLAPAGYRRPDHPEHPLRRITVGFGPGEGSRAALRAGADFAEHAGATLRTASLIVRPLRGSPSLRGAGLAYEAQLVSQLRDQTGDAVHQAVEGLRDPGLPRLWVDSEFGQGTTWPAAVDSIPWEADDLLMLGSRPRTGVRGVFLGSRAAEIVRAARVPVMVLPG